jgi:hypothetical protein
MMMSGSCRMSAVTFGETEVKLWLHLGLVERRFIIQSGLPY